MAWITSTVLTIQLMVAAVLVASIIGMVGAWAASILDRGNRFCRTLAAGFVVAMVGMLALPLILHATAWEATAGKFGWWMMTQTGSRVQSGGVYGAFSGLVAPAWIHGIYGAAIVGLATRYGTKRIPATLTDQGRLDFGPLAGWWRVRLPLAAPWWIAGMIATAALAATEMTVADLYGFRTLADQFYLYYSVEPTIESILVVLVIPLATLSSVLMWWLVVRRQWLAINSQRNRDDESDRARDAAPDASREISRAVFVVAALLVVTIIVGLVGVPAIGLVVKAGQDVVVVGGDVTTNWNGLRFIQRVGAAPWEFAAEFRWTAMLVTMVGVASVMVAWPLARLGRRRRGAEQAFDIASVILVCVPGPVVGLIVVRFFQLNVPGFSALYQQTLLPTTLALMVRGVPIAYWVLRSGYRGVETRVLESASLDSAWWRQIWSVDGPLLGRALWVAGLASAVVASGDLPATLPVIPAGVSTVSTRLFGLLHSGARYQESSLAIWFIASILLVVMASFGLGPLFTSRQGTNRQGTGRPGTDHRSRARLDP